MDMDMELINDIDEMLLWEREEECEEVLLTDDSGRVVQRLMTGGSDYDN